MIKVVHIQKHLPTSGNAAFRLHSAMLEAGVDSEMLSLSSDVSGDERIRHLGKINQLVSWIDGKILMYLTRKVSGRFGLFSFPFLGSDISDLEQIKSADIIYLHWVNGGFLNLKSIRKLTKLNKPIVFFMHDMWTITGGCHHSFMCDKYKSHCFSCQMFGERKKNDLSAKEFRKKSKLFKSYQNFHFISPSTWLYKCAGESGLTKDKPLHYIPNIIDNKLFKPFDKRIAKQILNIDPDVKVISFGAASIDSPYKGWGYLIKALELLKEKLKDENTLVVIFGSYFNRKMAETIPFKTKFVGRLRDDYSTALIYNAADVFIAPSLAETFGYVILESLACSTPVVGFNVGGIPDLIRHKENGYLANYRDHEDLATGVEYCLQNNVKGKMLDIFEPETVVNQHLDLFRSLGF